MKDKILECLKDQKVLSARQIISDISGKGLPTKKMKQTVYISITSLLNEHKIMRVTMPNALHYFYKLS